MPANTSPIFGLTANLSEATFVNADGTTPKVLWTPGANGGVLRRLNCRSDDTALINLDLQVHDGTTSYALGTAQVPIGAGSTAASASHQALDPEKQGWLTDDGEIFLPSGYTLRGNPQVAVTAAKTLSVVSVGVDY